MKDVLQDKNFIIALEEWNNHHELAAELEDVIVLLSEERPAYSRAINSLVSALVQAVEARTIALEELKKFPVIKCHDDALWYVCKYEDQRETDEATA